MSTHITTLENGLRVITNYVDSVETVALGVWVGVGSRCESKEVNGISHVLEHMAFKGTTSRTAKGIAEEIENVGGSLNAYTSHEVTSYQARILAKDIPLAVDILSDILQNPLFDEEEFERERGVILQEIAQSYDTPDDIIFDYFQATAYPDQAIGRPILGPESVIRRLTREDIKQYMEDTYAPQRMVVSAAGKVHHETFVQLVKEYFTMHLPGKEMLIEPAAYQGGMCRKSKDLEQVNLVCGFEGVSLLNSNYYANFVLSNILGGSMSSRLFQEVREKRGLAYSVYSYVSCYRDSGLFSIYAGTSPEHIDQLMMVIVEELNKIRDDIKPEEIQRAKAQLKASILMGLESISSRCAQQANQLLVFNRPLPAEEIIAKIDAVEREHLLQLAQTVFSSNPTVAALGPSNKLESLHAISQKLQLPVKR